MIFNTVLAKLGEKINCSKAYIIEIDWENRTMNATYEWNNPEELSNKKSPKIINSLLDNFRNIPLDNFPEWILMLQENEIINVRDMSSFVLGIPLFSDLEREGVKSLIAVSLYYNEKLRGFIGFDERKDFRTWDDATIGFLQTNARTIATVMGKKAAEEERNKLEEHLFQAQKLESVGRLAGGIAHEFNNILTGIMGFAEMLKMKHEGTKSSEEKAADIILIGTERASVLTQQLLGFAQKGKYVPVNLNINRVLDDAMKVVEKSFEKNIKVIYKLEDEIKTIKADKSQIQQVLINLIMNARDAMPDGGKLVFSSETVSLGEENGAKFTEFKPGTYVKFSVGDTGSGIPEELQTKIFEPFFTTREEQQCTGLGLATVYGIVKNHDGLIDVMSEVGKGTTMTVYFPAEEEKEML